MAGFGILPETLISGMGSLISIILAVLQVNFGVGFDASHTAASGNFLRAFRRFADSLLHRLERLPHRPGLFLGQDAHSLLPGKLSDRLKLFALELGQVGFAYYGDHRNFTFLMVRLSGL